MFEDEDRVIELIRSLIAICSDHTALIKSLQERIKILENK